MPRRAVEPTRVLKTGDNPADSSALGAVIDFSVGLPGDDCLKKQRFSMIVNKPLKQLKQWDLPGEYERPSPQEMGVEKEKKTKGLEELYELIQESGERLADVSETPERFDDDLEYKTILEKSHDIGYANYLALKAPNELSAFQKEKVLSQATLLTSQKNYGEYRLPVYSEYHIPIAQVTREQYLHRIIENVPIRVRSFREITPDKVIDTLAKFIGEEREIANNSLLLSPEEVKALSDKLGRMRNDYDLGKKIKDWGYHTLEKAPKSYKFEVWDRKKREFHEAAAERAKATLRGFAQSALDHSDLATAIRTHNAIGTLNDEEILQTIKLKLKELWSTPESEQKTRYKEAATTIRRLHQIHETGNK
ncbi:hypothetical protein MYX78_00215 [Acidobacteria bacterium AH-259-G07]|nr:hypothetical protein [Acidobacteria bacterium AH-259-G07]